jgi:nitrate reductase delta subunit
MVPTFKILPRYAALLEYPSEALPSMAAAAADELKWQPTIWLDLLEAFALDVQLIPMGEVEEMYTRTFDLNPSCTMEIGWHLFGESYKRGSFMANVREALRTHEVAEGSALPDYLPTLLRLLPKLRHDDAQDLTRDCILPALEKLRGAVGEGAGPYSNLLESLHLLLKDLAPGEGAALEAGCGSSDHACTCSHSEVNGKEAPHAH